MNDLLNSFLQLDFSTRVIVVLALVYVSVSLFVAAAKLRKNGRLPSPTAFVLGAASNHSTTGPLG